MPVRRAAIILSAARLYYYDVDGLMNGVASIDR
jgi:hypothetical protein